MHMHSELIMQEDLENEMENSIASTRHTQVALDTLTIADCAGLVEVIRQSLSQGISVVLDLTHCHEVDTAGMQLLVTIQNDPAVNLRVHWTKPSEVVAMKAARLGVQSWINAGFLEN
jgi:ABC-type transporter Mla MlaB component